MPMATVAGGIEIFYEVLDPAHGVAPRTDPRPLLLIQGLSGQLISWGDDFCAELTGRGFRVIRFDNRDVGLSTKLDGAGAPDLGRALAGDRDAAPYSIEDMAGDAAELLGALGVESAHVMGVSMGGMIAQALAIARPDRVASLCSIMSTTGDRSVGAPTPEGISAIFTPPPQDRAGVIEGALKTWRVLWGTGFPLDEDRIADQAGALYDRCNHPLGVARQVTAIIAAADRTEALGGLPMPVLVIHGDEDPLIAPSGGEATAKAIPGATYIPIPGMGHCLPRPVWGQVFDAMVANADRAAGSAGPAAAAAKK